MEKIIAYLKEKYRASSIIVYGAWADASQSEHSTFEALVMGPTSPYAHDVDIVEGVKLDVVVYPRDIFYGEIALEEFEQVHDGLVALDDDGMGTWLKRMIAQQIESIPAQPALVQRNVRGGEKWGRRGLVLQGMAADRQR